MYECGHATGLGVRSYAAMVGAWAVCGRFYAAIDRSLVEARPRGGVWRATGKGWVDNDVRFGRRAAFDGDNVWGSRFGRQAAVNVGNLGLA